MRRERRVKRCTAEPAPSRPTAYGYIRVSTETQAASGLGLAAQAEEITRYRRATLTEVAWGGIHRDAGVSAARIPFSRRPAGAKLMAALSRGDHLVIAKLDRAFRDTRDAAERIDEWHKAGVAVHILDIRVDTSTPVGRLIVDVMAAVAAWESRRIGERIKAAWAARAPVGIGLCGKPWMGFALDARGRPRPSARERSLMRRVVELRDKRRLSWPAIGDLVGASKQRSWRLYYAAKTLSAVPADRLRELAVIGVWHHPETLRQWRRANGRDKGRRR